MRHHDILAFVEKDGVDEAVKHFKVKRQSILAAMSKARLEKGIRKLSRSKHWRTLKAANDSPRYQQIWDYVKVQGHTKQEAAKKFEVTEGTIDSTLNYAKSRVGTVEVIEEPEVIEGKPIVEQRPTRAVYFLAKELDKKIIRSVKNTGHLGPIARMALLLTQEILGDEHE